MILRIFSILSLCAALNIATAQNLEEYFNGAKKAYSEKKFEAFYTLINKAHELHPYHQVILYQKGIAAALTNHQEESVKSLREAILINADFDLNIPDLLMLSGNKEFAAVKELQSKLKQSIIQSDTAFIIKDRSLHLESIAASERKGVFFGSSIYERKLVRIGKNGETTNFTTPTKNVAAVMGTKLHKRKKEVWICASPLPEMKNYDSAARSGVFQLELRTGKILKEFETDSIRDSILGDLIVSKKGEVFVSDSKSNCVLKVNRERGKLEVFYSNEAFWNIQGITFSDDEAYMFIADYIKGVFRLDMRTMQLIYVDRKVLSSLKGIDGLTFYKGSLIAIQNGVKPMRVTQYFLNKELNAVVDYRIIDRGHPAFNEPTNGCLVGDEFYYVANSQWSGYDENHQLLPEDKLQDIVLLKFSLD